MAVSPDVYIVRVDSDDDCICVGAEGGGRKGKTPANGNRRQKRSLRSAAIVVEDSPPAATVGMKIKPPSLDNKGKANLESLPARTESGNDSMPPLNKGLLTPTTTEVDGPPCKKQSLSIEVDGNDGPPCKKQSLSTTVHSNAEAHSTLHHGNEDEVEPMETSPSAVTDSTANQSDRDFQVALQLHEQLNGERTPYSAADEELARKLQSEEYVWDINNKSLLMADEKLAKRLQKVEDDAAVKVVKATKIIVNPSTNQQSMAAAKTSTSVEAATVTNSPQHFDTSVTGSKTATQLHSQGTHSQPSNWTVCPECPPDAVRTYHLIKLPPSSEEWIQISAPLTSVGFHVTAVQRIQNNTLWQRFQAERQLMVQGRPEGFDVNEKILFHTSKAAKHVICEEGLDQRLSRIGSFGSGIYFSDDPRKCDCYGVATGKTRTMFACHVLLGDMKIYPNGQSDQTLRREPPKVAPRPGETKTFDSVMGNVSGHNEYIVYNTYRVFLEYVLQYTHGRGGHSYNIPRPLHLNLFLGQTTQNFTITQPAAPLTAPSGASCQLCGGIPASCVCGLNSKRQCKYCKRRPFLCTCPSLKTAGGDEIPYRCLTSLFQRQVQWREWSQKVNIAVTTSTTTSVGSSNNSKKN